MPHAGFFAFLAKGPIRHWAEPTQFRQTICSRLSGDARLGQNSARAAAAEGRDRKNVREISGSISPPDRRQAGEHIELITHTHNWRRHVERSETSLVIALSCRANSRYL